MQGRGKQSVDGQAQLDVGDEDVNNSREARGKILDLASYLAVRRRSHSILQPSLEV